MFYYLTVSYDIGDLTMGETSYLSGPFQTAEARDKAMDDDLGKRDLETEEVVNVTKLKVEDGKLVSEGSFLASDECEGGDDEDDEDSDEDDDD